MATIAVGLAGIVWFALYLTPVRLGFDDTDSPAVSLAFLRGHSEIYTQMGIVLILMAIALTVATFAVSDTLSSRSGSLALRATSAFGLFSAAFFFMFGVVLSACRMASGSCPSSRSRASWSGA